MQADTQEKAKIGPVCEVHLLLLFQLAQSSAEWVGWQEVICVTWISFSLLSTATYPSLCTPAPPFPCLSSPCTEKSNHPTQRHLIRMSS